LETWRRIIRKWWRLPWKQQHDGELERAKKTGKIIRILLQHLCKNVNDLPEVRVRNKFVELVEEGAWTARYRPWEKLKGNLADAGPPLNVTLTEECEPADDVAKFTARSIDDDDDDDKFLEEEEKKNPD
jgi:hypothetical protein